MTISVIIATYNRSGLLRGCLRHLAGQRFLPGDEVIVVDNGSTDDTPVVIERQRRLFAVPVEKIEERRPGKSAALRAAIAKATGDILAFTDDDIHVGPRWLEEIRSAMGDRELALMGGPVLPRWEREPPSWFTPANGTYGRLAAPLALLNYGAETIELGPRTLLGANLAVRRDVLARVGGFAPGLGKLRGTLLSGEDHELCARVQAAGFRAMYWPLAPVSHWVPRSRARIPYVLSWFFWSGITHAILDVSQPSTRTLVRVPRWIVARFGHGVLDATAALATGRTTEAVSHAADAAFALGYAARSCGLVGRHLEGGALPLENTA